LLWIIHSGSFIQSGSTSWNRTSRREAKRKLTVDNFALRPHGELASRQTGRSAAAISEAKKEYPDDGEQR